jgi:hypothetical protein
MPAVRTIAGGLDGVLDAIPPAAGAEVTGTGSVSVEHHGGVLASEGSR